MPTKGQIQHIIDCYENFVENCGIKHRTFDEMWLNGHKYFLHQESNSAKFLRRECITLYMQFTNILEDCKKYNITEGDLEYKFYLNDMRKFLDTYKGWICEQFNNPDTIL